MTTDRLHDQCDERANLVPSGNWPTRLFPVVHQGVIPVVDLSSWSLSVTGEVFDELHLGWSDFMALSREEREIDLHCVAGWSVMGSCWEGVSLRTLLTLTSFRNDARYIMLHCDGGYTTGVPLAAADDMLLAVRRNGATLAPEHGFPVRAVVSGRYAWKSAKWLRRIELMPAERAGYREWYGYHPNADPWQEERVAE